MIFGFNFSEIPLFGSKRKDSEILYKKTKEKFEKGEIELPVYGVSLELPPHRYYRWDKEVDSLKEHTLSVFREFGLSESSLTESDKEQLASSTGHSREIEVDQDGYTDKFLIGFILKGNEKRPKEFQLFNEAHEQAHMIFSLDKKSFDSLLDHVSSKLGIKIDVNDLDEETICTILGLLALELHGIPSNVFNFDNSFMEAHKILKERSTPSI